MFFQYETLLTVLKQLYDKRTFFYREKCSDTHEIVIEMTLLADPKTGEIVNKLHFGEVLSNTARFEDRRVVSMIGNRVKITLDGDKSVYGGMDTQRLLDFGLSREEIKLLKIIYRLVRNRHMCYNK